jgi:hypothetical protein
MKQILVLPTWILLKIAMPFFPKKHEWKGRRFTLLDWSEHSTEVNNMFSFFFWIAGSCLFIVVLSFFV